MARNWGKVKDERRKDTNGEKWEGTAVWPHLRRASSSSLFALLPHIPSPPHLPSISSSLWSISNFFLYTTFPNAQNGHREAPTAAAIRVESGWYLLRPDLNELISGLGLGYSTLRYASSEIHSAGQWLGAWGGVGWLVEAASNRSYTRRCHCPGPFLQIQMERSLSKGSKIYQLFVPLS